MNQNTALPTPADHSPELLDLASYRIDVIVPAYNEERFIGSVILKLLQYPVTVLVVDDGSTDDTALVARLAGATVLQHETNLGKGQALNTGFQAVRQLAPDAIVTIDADGQHRPEQLPVLVQPILEGKADIVIGSRYLHPPLGIPRLRRWGHRFFNLLNHSMTGIPVTDSQSGYRAFSPKAFQSDFFHCTDFSVESEMQFLAQEFGLKVHEVEISADYASQPKRSVWAQGLTVLGGIIRLAGQYRPLLYFGIPGFSFLLGGLLLGVRVAERFYQVGQLATGTALVSVMLSIFGLTLLSTGITLHSVRGLLSEMLRSKKAP